MDVVFEPSPEFMRLQSRKSIEKLLDVDGAEFIVCAKVPYSPYCHIEVSTMDEEQLLDMVEQLTSHLESMT